MYIPRIERANKIYPVKVYNKKGELTQYISWVELEAKADEEIAKDVKKIRITLNAKNCLIGAKGCMI